MIPYAIRGAIWYQGESNADQAWEYRFLFPLMIRGWRKAWKQGDFPFLFVQLPNYSVGKNEPGEGRWAELREAQALALRLPQTGMAVTMDVGDANDVHPKNKHDVGARLAAWALNRVYHMASVAPSGPLYRSCKREGSRIRIHFTHVDGGLCAKNGPLRGFAVASADGAFVSAKAKIEKDTVVVWSPLVRRPVSVRYDWADNPAGNLCNRARLPAAPFRTDNRRLCESP
jgi:sialate O-acetylesterase